MLRMSPGWRRMKAGKRRTQIVEELRAEGWSVAEIAKKLGVSPATVSRENRRVAQRDALPPGLDPAALPLDPEARLATIMSRWLDIADESQQRLLDSAREGVFATQPAITGGIATQRALELADRLETTGLPRELPEDDEAKRAAVMGAWWRVARRGSGNAIRHLAAMLGLARADDQGIELAFERPEAPPPEDSPPPAPPSPGGNPRIH
jgi:transcriptional regulator with XRE-family HTH domain